MQRILVAGFALVLLILASLLFFHDRGSVGSGSTSGSGISQGPVGPAPASSLEDGASAATPQETLASESLAEDRRALLDTAEDESDVLSWRAGWTSPRVARRSGRFEVYALASETRFSTSSREPSIARATTARPRSSPELASTRAATSVFRGRRRGIRSTSACAAATCISLVRSRAKPKRAPRSPSSPRQARCCASSCAHAMARPSARSRSPVPARRRR